MDQEIRFVTASDGVRLAYAKFGHGPPLVKASNWLTHLEFDWQSAVWSPWLEELGKTHTVIRCDMRGCGLSDRNPEDQSLDRWVDDMTTVLDAAEVDRAAMLGISGGAAIALAFAARYPERVDRIVSYGGYGRGRFFRDNPDQLALFRNIILTGWNQPHAAFRRAFTMLFLPDATPEQMEWWDDLQRQSADPAMAVRIFDTLAGIDTEPLLPSVTAPVLVLHTRGDLVVPLEEGRRIAAAVKSARMVTLESRNHILLKGEPAWPVFVEALRDFLGVQPGAAPTPRDDLSAREREVMALVAQGKSNEEIADALFVSVRTVERHLSNVYVKLRVSGKAARAAAAARFSQAV